MKTKEYILGVTVTNRSVFAVLVHDGPEGPVALRQYSRPRSSGEMMAAPPTEEFAKPETDDPSVAFMSGGSDESSMFLASEFDLAGPDHKDSNGGELESYDIGMRPSTVEIELTDILSDLEDEGFGDVGVVFCINSTDLATQELVVPKKGARQPEADKGAKKKNSKSAFSFGKTSDRERFLGLLAQSAEGRFDPEQTVFLPMTPDGQGQRRALAVFPRPSEAIIPTLRRFVDRNRTLPFVQAVGTEISLLTGLSRLATGVEDAPATRSRMIVRVGADDTLVVFLEGGTIRSLETLRSITVFDSPETVCSRILLLQDEYGFGEAEEMLVLGEENEASLLARFSTFFPEAHVESLREYLPTFEDEFEQGPSREAALAAGVTLRFVSNAQTRGRFEDVDLLPKRLLKKRRVNVGFQWQVYALLIILFSTTLFFMARYFTQSHKKEMLEYQISQYDARLVEGNVRDLQARIDSMQAVGAGYVRALDVIDSLLVGSDRWSRTMERTAREAAAVPGLWIERWNESGNQLELIGNATHRDQVVRLAARMDGVIQSLSFSEIRDWPVYSFEMTIDIPNELPEAARYLRERAASSSRDTSTPVETVAWDGTAGSKTN